MCGIEVPEKRKELLDLLAANIAIINDELKTVGLLIRKGLDEDTGDSCFMLINTQNRMVGQNRDLGTRVQTQFSQSELDYLRLVDRTVPMEPFMEIFLGLALNRFQGIIWG